MTLAMSVMFSLYRSVQDDKLKKNEGMRNRKRQNPSLCRRVFSSRLFEAIPQRLPHMN